MREIRHTVHFLDHSKIVGRDADRLRIVEMLCENNKNDLQVVVIVGMTGRGKTTLARAIYNSDEVMRSFPKKCGLLYLMILMS